jgi:IS605 OrfB family transposase
MTTSEKLLNRAFKFRLYPNPVQVAELSEYERQLRWLWNLAHEQRLLAQKRPREERPRIDYFRQSKEMTEIVKEKSELGRVICCARQETLRHLDRAWQRYYKRLGGRPKFKRRIDRMGIYFSTTKHWKVELGNLTLAGAASSLGPIKIKQDRPWPGDAQFTSCHIVRDVDQWFAVFPLEFTIIQVRHKGHAVGINRGAIHAIADSNGRVVDSPRYYVRGLKKIAKLSRVLDRRTSRRKKPEFRYRQYCGDKESLDRNAAMLGISSGALLYHVRKKGSLELAIAHVRAHPPKALTVLTEGETGVRVLGRNREKARIALAKAHRDIRRKREWFLHDQSSHYTKHYALIGIEDWSTRDMTSSEPDENVKAPKHLLNRKILDVGWYELARQIDYKAEATGSQVVKVNPGIRDDKENVAGISKTCSGCGKALDVAASGNQYSLCDACNRSELGDVNAARNVLLRAILSKRETPTKREKTSIKIKGRTFRPKTSVKPIDEASGGDAPRRAPVDGGKAAREGGYPERTDKPQ